MVFDALRISYAGDSLKISTAFPLFFSYFLLSMAKAYSFIAEGVTKDKHA